MSGYDDVHLLYSYLRFFVMPQMAQMYQTRGILVTPAFFNYQILESALLVKSTLFIVAAAIWWEHSIHRHQF